MTEAQMKENLAKAYERVGLDEWADEVRADRFLHPDVMKGIYEALRDASSKPST